MKVPWFISLPLCLIVGLVMWFVGIHGKDFTTPPDEARIAEIKQQWEKDRPNIPPPKPIDPSLFADSSAAVPQTPSQPTEQVKRLPLGDLNCAPSLSEYGEFGDEGSEAMVRLATELEAKGHYPRALLAWERVIDTTEPSNEERDLALRSIRRLSNGLGVWNPDPAADIPLVLHAGATLKDKKMLEDALQQTADHIGLSSGHVLGVTIKASIGRGSGIKTPRVPVAIWFARPAGQAGQGTAATPPISFMADPKQPGSLGLQIQAGVYQLVRSHLADHTQFSALPEFPANTTPDNALRYHITRLMWREFAKSLKE